MIHALPNSIPFLEYLQGRDSYKLEMPFYETNYVTFKSQSPVAAQFLYDLDFHVGLIHSILEEKLLMICAIFLATYAFLGQIFTHL